MSRSGYSDDCDETGLLHLYRGSVERAIRGKRGQALLRDLRDALDTLPQKRLIAGCGIDENGDEIYFLEHGGEACALGALGRKRGIDTGKIDAEDPDEVAAAFGIARSLAAEIEYENDEGRWYGPAETPEQRWQRMRAWVDGQIKETP
jgi:hypothetical protein